MLLSVKMTIMGHVVRSFGTAEVRLSRRLPFELEHVATIVSAEVDALVEVHKLALQIGCNKIFIQMDNLVVVEALNHNTGYSMIYAPIFDEFCALLEESEKVFIEHCN
jgi:hypothetical protein